MWTKSEGRSIRQHLSSAWESSRGEGAARVPASRAGERAVRASQAALRSLRTSASPSVPRCFPSFTLGRCLGLLRPLQKAECVQRT